MIADAFVSTKTRNRAKVTDQPSVTYYASID